MLHKTKRVPSIRVTETHPKWRANATTAFLSFHKSEIGIAFPFKSNTFTVSSKLVVSSLTTEVSIPVHIRTFNTSSAPNYHTKLRLVAEKMKKVEKREIKVFLEISLIGIFIIQETKRLKNNKYRESRILQRVR